MSNPLAVFAVVEYAYYFMSGRGVKNEGLQWLLDELSVEEDEELGIERVEVAVKAAPDGTLFDVLLNDLSVGYFAIKAYCQCVPGLKMPALLAFGEEENIALPALLDDSDYGIYLVPMFGEVASPFGEAAPC